jgi:hypothetical protein
MADLGFEDIASCGEIVADACVNKLDLSSLFDWWKLCNGKLPECILKPSS